jgi:hypothetical protein
MKFIGLHTAGTDVPLGGLCPKNVRRTPVFLLILLLPVWMAHPGEAFCQHESILTIPPVLIPGKHNTTPIMGCTGYNPALLTFTTPTSGGLPPYSYQWQLNNAAILGETLSFYNPPPIIAAGSFSFNCAITDANGTAVYTMAKLIIIVPDPVVTISGGGEVCLNTTITLISTVTDGIGTFTYQWQSSLENLQFDTIPGATASTYSPDTATAGTLFYRVSIFPAVGSCNNSTSGAMVVTVIATPYTSLIYHL